MKTNTKILAGTTILGALVVVFDYTLKFSGLKIPFPLVPYIKFDLTGIPIALSMLLFGLIPGATTSAIAFLAILARSGDLVGPSMKALAEFSTITGIAVAIMLFKNTKTFKIARLTTAFLCVISLFLFSYELMQFRLSETIFFSWIFAFSFIFLLWLEDRIRTKRTEKQQSNKPALFIFGCSSRILVMFFANLIIQPYFYQMPFDSVLLLSPSIGVFNLIQGFLNIFGGYLIYEALKRRFPALIPRVHA